MALLKKGLTLSMIGITILVLAFSFWNDKRLEALANNEDWSSSYTFQYDINNDVIINHNDYNYIEQGSGVVESVFLPIKTVYDRLVNTYHKIGSFFGIVDLSDTLQSNETYYGLLKDVYLNWTLYEEQGSGYQFYISSSTGLFYSPDDGFYYEETYSTFLGVRLWRTNTKVLTFEELDLYNDQYSWV
jgi:hypothetical protein